MLKRLGICFIFSILYLIVIGLFNYWTGNPHYDEWAIAGATGWFFGMLTGYNHTND